MDAILIGIIGVLALVIIWIIMIFNSLVTLRTRIDGAWSQIDVQLKRRYDLIPNLVATVKGYAKHEKDVFENVTKARSALMTAQGPAAKADANNMLTGALKSLFAVAEAYPQLKANENFKALQDELTGTENKIAYSRQFYNDSVMEYNTKIQLFPGSLIAGSFGFIAREYFKIEEAAREAVKVSF
ncbi:LemA family protein [Candidatus Gugararchaeum adminiculabundum]|nr:LemA family protein [Candidatus Gugararchaeum adminiculabundum]